MPKLPILSGADVVKALGRLGFEQVRQRGSHVVMSSCVGGGQGAVVPMHREVKLGTLSGILRQAQVGQDEFLGAVK
jgi:predicted RNA binding protein YcfA (HicA-like mRNA interferase family)